MTERIHRCLDGELPRSLLSSEETAELEALQEASDAARAYVAAPAFPDLAGRVMRALPDPAPSPATPVRLASRVRAALAWTWAPRTLVLRPAYALGGAFALVLSLALAPDRPAPRADAAAEVMYVQFRLDAPGAHRVALAGSFSDWEPRHELREVSPGVWKAMVPVRPGVHDYLFVVDGKRWVADPAARPADDGFGGTNSRLYLAPPHART